jgi:hypothetical protein
LKEKQTLFTVLASYAKCEEYSGCIFQNILWCCLPLANVFHPHIAVYKIRDLLAMTLDYLSETYIHNVVNKQA